MAEIKQIERIIRILQRLAISKEITVKELYHYFDQTVPIRTIQRDLIELSSADIPLMTKQGKGKELIWYLDSKFLKFIPETIGSRELLVSFFLKKLSTILKGTSLEKDISSLIKKSKQLLASDIFYDFADHAPSDQIFGTTFSGYIDYSPHSKTIDTLIEAATKTKLCHVTYKPTWKSEPSEFLGEAYVILLHKGGLYAVMRIPKYDNFLFLPIQRIMLLKLLNTNFIRDPKFDIDSLKKNRFGIYSGNNLKPKKVILKFNKDIAEIVAERTWHQSQKLKHHRDGSLTLEMKVIVSDELRSWIGSWLKYVKVIQPKDLMKT